MKNQEFVIKVWDNYHSHGRSLPWRDRTDAYAIVVSELMLQQTQVQRVIPKFETFMATFPTVQALADAPQSDVIELWSGLGYNRRARFLHQTAKKVVEDFDGNFPDTVEGLVSLPGIGVNTAGAVLAYAFNIPRVFIETNIRSVYIYEFFPDSADVSDAELVPLIEATLDTSNPREWYWALMDYGTMLKKQVGNSARQSKHYKKQSKFEGSKRQVRGAVLRLLINGPIKYDAAKQQIADERFDEVVEGLVAEQLVLQQDSQLKLA